jgi:hypothetical protein
MKGERDAVHREPGEPQCRRDDAYTGAALERCRQWEGGGQETAAAAVIIVNRVLILVLIHWYTYIAC